MGTARQSSAGYHRIRPAAARKSSQRVPIHKRPSDTDKESLQASGAPLRGADRWRAKRTQHVKMKRTCENKQIGRGIPQTEPRTRRVLEWTSKVLLLPLARVALWVDYFRK